MKTGRTILALAIMVVAGVSVAQRWVGEGRTYNRSVTYGDGGTTSVSVMYPDGGLVSNLNACSLLGESDGVDLTSATAFRVNVSVPSNSDGGQASLSGAGSLLCCVRSVTTSGSEALAANTSSWKRCKTNLDITSLPEASVSYSEPDYSTGVGAGRIWYVPAAVTTDGGTGVRTTVTVQYKSPTNK